MEWINELKGALHGYRFFKKGMASEGDAVAERIQDMSAIYAPHDYVRKATLQDNNITDKTHRRQEQNDVSTDDVFLIRNPGINAVRRNAISNSNSLEQCTAKKQQCYHCGLVGHYTRCCRQNSGRQKNILAVDEVAGDLNNSLNYIMMANGNKIAVI
ncbi:hypothetical protein GJ496_004851 [Pomphorhynchus laevis]|nr:hypothetical protein GJ496_004851 [Pomphorhynchus laevis]